jgi:DNA-binding MarR family transcriptional regulator
VILGPYPAALGFLPAVIGAVFTASRMSGALSTMAFTAVAGRDGHWGAVPAAPRAEMRVLHGSSRLNPKDHAPVFVRSTLPFAFPGNRTSNVPVRHHSGAEHILFDGNGVRPITAGQLAVEMGLTTGAITGIVDRLEQAGFVRRKRDRGDRRQVILEVIMGKVRREVFPLFEQLGQHMSALAASYSPRDLATITDFVERGVAMSREYRAKLRARRRRDTS